MKRQIHIQAAEGGLDSQLFVQDLAKVFEKVAARQNWKIVWLESSKNVVLEISGPNVDRLDQESGGYRIQRIPPTERHNRTHTSTVTVAVMNVDVSTNPSFDQIADSDFRIEWFSGTGAGGQHRNKSQNSCRVIHIPTGISEARQSRSRENNYLEAKKAILETLKNKKTSENHDKFSDTKASKLGSGMRGDKLLTIQFQNDKVTHHVTGKTCTAKQFMKGEVDRLWNTKEAV